MNFSYIWGLIGDYMIAAALGAVISLCSTDDRYADDVHYMGGAVLANEMLGWAMTFLGFNVKPPDPLVVGDRWRRMSRDGKSPRPYPVSAVRIFRNFSTDRWPAQQAVQP